MDKMERNFTENLLENSANSEHFSGFIINWVLSVPLQKFIYISKNFENLTGYKVEDIYLNPKLWLNLIQNYDQPRLSRRIENDEIYFESTYTMRNKSGKLIKIKETIIPIFNGNEELIQLSGKSMVKNMELTEQSIINYHYPFPFFTMEKINNQWKLISFSKKFEELVQHDSLTTNDNNHNIERFIKIIDTKLEESKNKDRIKFIYESSSLDNDIYYQFELIKEVEHDGKIKVTGWGCDITEIKLNEKRLEKLNSDKNKLLSIVSHDLKAPFNSILNFINLLNDEIEIDGEQKRELLKYIHDLAKNQLELIHDLLDWSKVESGLLEFKPTFIKIHNLINKILSGFSGQIHQKSIQIIKEFDKDTRVFFDKNYLGIVLSNIISNAIKFSHRNSKIIISAHSDREYTNIIIQDFGIGFSEKFFKQLTNSNNINLQVGTMGEKGTGLGLKFCYDIITSNYGKLLIESKSQKGTKVVLKFKNPQLTALYFGSREELYMLKHFSQKILPDLFLYLCNDVFELLRFTEVNPVDIAFINLEEIKTFQHSFVEKILLSFNENCQIVGLAEDINEIKENQWFSYLNDIQELKRFKEVITDRLRKYTWFQKS